MPFYFTTEQQGIEMTLLITDWPSIMVNHGPTNMANHEPTIMANQNKSRIRRQKCNQENRIGIFDPILFEDTVVSKIMEDFNTKCYVMNNEEKLFQQKQSLDTLFLLMKKRRAKKFKVRMFYHLQNLFWGCFVRGVLAWGVFVREVFVGGVCPGVLS